MERIIVTDRERKQVLNVKMDKMIFSGSKLELGGQAHRIKVDVLHIYIGLCATRIVGKKLLPSGH